MSTHSRCDRDRWFTFIPTDQLQRSSHQKRNAVGETGGTVIYVLFAVTRVRFSLSLCKPMPRPSPKPRPISVRAMPRKTLMTNASGFQTVDVCSREIVRYCMTNDKIYQWQWFCFATRLGLPRWWQTDRPRGQKPISRQEREKYHRFIERFHPWRQRSSPRSDFLYQFLSRRGWTQTEQSSNEHFLRIFVLPSHGRWITCTSDPASSSSSVALPGMTDLLDKPARRSTRWTTTHRSSMNRWPVVPGASSLVRNGNQWWNARNSCGWRCTLLDREHLERDGQFLPQATVYSNEGRFEQKYSEDFTCIFYRDSYSRELSRPDFSTSCRFVLDNERLV